jgi:hypothetical protein
MIPLTWTDVGDGYGFWRASASVASGATSDYIRVNYNNSKTTVAVYPSNRARAQYTIDSPEEIVAATAVWIDWPLGNITSARTDTLLGVVTGIRLVSVSGTASMEVLSI